MSRESTGLYKSVLQCLIAAITKNVDNGAATQINCAVNPELNKQKMVYYADSAPKEPTAAARYVSYCMYDAVLSHCTCVEMGYNRSSCGRSVST